MKYFSYKLTKKLPVICNIPHSSIVIPKKFLSDFSLSKRDLSKEVRFMADLYTDKIYKNLFDDFGFILSKVSRIVVDIERFSDDNREPMSEVGMGVLYTKTSDGRDLRKVEKKRKKEYLDELYKPYHEQLDSMVKKDIKEKGKCLIIDCHSFPSKDREYDSDKKLNRTDICIGTDNFHTPIKLKKLLKSNFEKAGFTVKYNSPFSGTIVPMAFYNKNKNVNSVMIEINRKLYMNEDNFTLNYDCQDFSKKVCNIIKNSVSDFLK